MFRLMMQTIVCVRVKAPGPATAEKRLFGMETSDWIEPNGTLDITDTGKDT